MTTHGPTPHRMAPLSGHLRVHVAAGRVGAVRRDRRRETGIVGRRSAEGIGAIFISEYRGAGCDMLRYDVYRTRVPSLWRAAGWLFGSIKSGCDATMRRRLPSTGAHGAI